MTAVATTIATRPDQLVGQPIDIVAVPAEPASGVRQSITAFIDTVFDRLAGFVVDPADVSTAAPSSAPSRVAIAGSPDPRITRLVRFGEHHS